jgi:hypothetical protein
MGTRRSAGSDLYALTVVGWFRLYNRCNGAEWMSDASIWDERDGMGRHMRYSGISCRRSQLPMPRFVDAIFRAGF